MAGSQQPSHQITRFVSGYTASHAKENFHFLSIPINAIMARSAVLDKAQILW
jgi:hypothetical protein